MGHVAWVTLLLRHDAPAARPRLPPRGFFFLRELCSGSSAVRFCWRATNNVGIGALQRGTPSRSTRPVEPRPARERSGETRTRSRTYSKVRGTRPAFPLAYAPSSLARFPRLARSQISRASGRPRKGSRPDAPDAKHANRRPTSSPFVAWTRFVAARALENAPRSSSARLRGARAPSEPLSALSPVLSFRLAIVPRREHQLWAVVSATIIFTKVLFS